MKVSKLIERLQQAQVEFGDLEIITDRTNTHESYGKFGKIFYESFVAGEKGWIKSPYIMVEIL